MKWTKVIKVIMKKLIHNIKSFLSYIYYIFLMGYQIGKNDRLKKENEKIRNKLKSRE